MSSVPVQGTKVPHAELSRPGGWGGWGGETIVFFCLPREQSCTWDVLLSSLISSVRICCKYRKEGRRETGRKGRREEEREECIKDCMTPCFLDHMSLEEEFR